MTRHLALVALTVVGLGSATARAESPREGAQALEAPTLATVPPAPPADDPKPRTGLGGMIVGFAGLAIGTVNLAFLPVCEPVYGSDFFEGSTTERQLRACRISSGVFGAGGYIAAAIGLGIGVPRWRRYKAWKRRHGYALLSDWSLSFAPLRGGGEGRWVGRF